MTNFAEITIRDAFKTQIPMDRGRTLALLVLLEEMSPKEAWEYAPQQGGVIGLGIRETIKNARIGANATLLGRDNRRVLDQMEELIAL